MADVTAPQFQQDVNNAADWANGDENTTVTMRLGQQADSPAKTIKDIKDAGSEAAGSIQFTVKGAFADGFTIDYYFELGETATGEIYRYKRPNALPFVVPAGFDPTVDGRFEQWVNTDHNNLTNRNAVGAHDASAIQTPSGVPLSGDVVFGSDATLSGTIYLIDGKIKPENGVTVTVGSDCKVISNGEWRDESLGGSIVLEAGAFEQRLLDKTTSPTGQYTINIGWPDNEIDESSGGSFVRGGTQSFPHKLGASSQLSVIDGAYDNWIGNDCIASSIHGGAHHRAHDGASHVGIMSGSYQEAFADYVTLGGGNKNKGASVYGGVFTGQSNEAGDPAWETDQEKLDNRSSAVLSGALNKARARRSGIGSGLQNLTSGFESWIGAGTNNTASGERATVPCGNSNTASGNDSLASGTSCTASGQSSLSIGQSNTSSGIYAVSFGEFTESSGPASMATGQRSKATLRGQHAHASGYFAIKGDAQKSSLVARTQTDGSQTKTLDLFGGISNPILIPNNTTWLFKINLVARGDEGTNGAWIYEGCIKKDATSGSASIVGTTVERIINSITNASVTVSANTSNGSLSVQVATTASITESIRWVANIELTEVSF